MGEGYNAQEISRQLGIRCDTVRHTLSRVYKRIGVRDRAQAVGWCLCHGLISRHEFKRRYPLERTMPEMLERSAAEPPVGSVAKPVGRSVPGRRAAVQP